MVRISLGGWAEGELDRWIANRWPLPGGIPCTVDGGNVKGGNSYVILSQAQQPLVLGTPFRPDLLGEWNACNVSAEAQKSLMQHGIASLWIVAAFC